MTLSTQVQGFKYPFTALPHRTSQKARGTEGWLRPRASSPQARGGSGTGSSTDGKGFVPARVSELCRWHLCRYLHNAQLSKDLPLAPALRKRAAGLGDGACGGHGSEPGRGRGARSREAAGGQRPLRHRRPQPPGPEQRVRGFPRATPQGGRTDLTEVV